MLVARPVVKGRPTLPVVRDAWRQRLTHKISPYEALAKASNGTFNALGCPRNRFDEIQATLTLASKDF
jgi:hypothetical protein